MRKAAMVVIILFLASVGNATDFYRYTNENGSIGMTTSPTDHNIKYTLVFRDDRKESPLEKASFTYIQTTCKTSKHPEILRRILQQLYAPSRRDYYSASSL